MSYTPEEIKTFSIIERTIQAEFGSLDATRKQTLAGLLSHPIEPIAQAIKTPKCYDMLKELLEHPPTENIKKLTQLAISLAVLECPKLASKLRDSVIDSRHELRFTHYDNLQNLNLQQIQALFGAIKAVPELSMLDLKKNDLGQWNLEQVQALAEAIIAAPQLSKLVLSSNHLYKWNLEQIQILADAITAAPQLSKLVLSFNYLFNWRLEHVQAFAKAITAAPQLSTLDFSKNTLGKWNIQQVQALAEAITAAPQLRAIDFSYNDLEKWDFEQVQVFADAIKAAIKLSSIDLRGNDLSQWNLEQIRVFAEAIKAAPHLSMLDLSGNGLGQWNLEQAQVFADIIKDNFSLCFIGRYGIPEAIQSLVNRNKRIQTQIQEWEAFFHKPVTESTSKQVTLIHAQLVTLEETFTDANSFSANQYLSRLARIRLDAFNLSFSYDQPFIDCYGWLLDSHYQWIPLDEHQQKIVDAVLLKAVGSDLSINHTLSSEQRLTLLKYLFLNLQKADYPAPSDYSPNFYSSAPNLPTPEGKLKGIPMLFILARSDEINQQFEALSKEYKNPILQQLYETIFANAPAQEAVEQSYQQTFSKC